MEEKSLNNQHIDSYDTKSLTNKLENTQFEEITNNTISGTLIKVELY